MKPNFKNLKIQSLGKCQMSHVKGGVHLKLIDGKWVVVVD